MKKPSVYDCGVIELPKIHFRAGNITPIEGNVHLPFELERIFYLYDIPGGESRGAHAHKECHQFLIAASGSFEVMLDDGINNFAPFGHYSAVLCCQFLPLFWYFYIGTARTAIVAQGGQF